jgi:alanine racemase
MSTAVAAEIDLGALQHNLSQARRLARGARITAVIKADGYGHGMVRVARALPGVEAFGVARLDEGLVLREARITQRIVLLGGAYSLQELVEMAGSQLELVVHHESQLGALEAADLAAPLTVWLKIDTGMHRLGFAPAAARQVWQRLRRCANVGAIHHMTHLASAEDRADALTTTQVQRFSDSLRDTPGERSIANSAGLMAWTSAVHADLVRPGIMLYGAAPFPSGSGADFGLRPVMTLRTRLIAVTQRSRGDALGYGGTWTCPEDMPVGIAAIGYGDGYPRHAPSGTPVLVNGRRVQLVGRVSMDMIALDLRGVPGARVGDPVLLWGPGLPAEEVARHAGTIPYALFCGVTARVARRYLDAPGP